MPNSLFQRERTLTPGLGQACSRCVSFRSRVAVLARTAANLRDRRRPDSEHEGQFIRRRAIVDHELDWPFLGGGLVSLGAYEGYRRSRFRCEWESVNSKTGEVLLRRIAPRTTSRYFKSTAKFRRVFPTGPLSRLRAPSAVSITSGSRSITMAMYSSNRTRLTAPRIQWS